MGEVFLAYDRTTQQPVALKIVREESRMPGDDEALRQELLLARSVSQPERLPRPRSRAVAATGPILVMEHITGQTLHTHIRRKKAQGGYTSDEFRRIAQRDLRGRRRHPRAGPRARRSQAGQRHGHVEPRRRRSARPSSSTSASRRSARASRARRPGAPPDGGTPNYMAPERLRSGGASTGGRRLRARPHALGDVDLPRPRARLQAAREADARSRSCSTCPPGSVDRRDQADLPLPRRRSAAAPAGASPALLQPDRRSRRTRSRSRASASIPGRRPAAARSDAFAPGAQALLATFATNAPEFVGELIVARQADAHDRPPRRQRHLSSPRRRSAASTRTLRWQNGSWIIEDLGSTNGTYVEHTYERKKVVNLMHGGEVQLGELRFKLVSFARESAAHKRARAYLAQARRPHRPPHCASSSLKALDEEAAFGEWVERRSRIARYELRGPEPPRLRSPDDPRDARVPSRRDARRRAHRHAPALAHRRHRRAHRAARFAVAMVGPGPQEARNLVEQVVGQVQGSCPKASISSPRSPATRARRTCASSSILDWALTRQPLRSEIEGRSR